MGSLLSLLVFGVVTLVAGGLLLSQWVRNRHSHWRFLAAKYAFKLYVACNRLCGRKPSNVGKNKEPISLELQLMDDFFRTAFKSSFCNHSDQSAKHLLDETRVSRNGFLLVTTPPVTNANISIQTDNICDTKVVWVKNKISTSNENLRNSLIVSLHGGAYVSGCAESCLSYLVPICEQTGLTGMSINYNLAPEYPLPSCVNQTVDILKYLNEKTEYKKIALVGDSAGGSLLLLAMQKIQKECAELMPACGVTISTWDVPTEGDSYVRNREKDALLDQSTGKTWGQMAVGNIDKNGRNTGKNLDLDGEVFSYLSDKTSFEGLPPLLLTLSEWECVSDDSLRIMERCKEYNVPVEVAMTAGTGLHVLEVLQGYDIPEAKHLILKESEFILKHL